MSTETLKYIESLRELGDPIVDPFDGKSTFSELSKKGLPWCRYCGARISPAWYSCDWGRDSLCNAHGVRAVLSNGPHNLDLRPYLMECPNPDEPMHPELNSETRFLKVRLRNRAKRGRCASLPKTHSTASNTSKRRRTKPSSPRQQRVRTKPNPKPRTSTRINRIHKPNIKPKPHPRIIKPKPKPLTPTKKCLSPLHHTFFSSLTPKRAGNQKRDDTYRSSSSPERTKKQKIDTPKIYGSSRARVLNERCRGTQIIGRARWLEPINNTIFESNTKKMSNGDFNAASRWLDVNWESEGVVEDALKVRQATNFAVLKDAQSEKIVTCGLLDKVDWAPSGFEYLGTSAALRILIFVTGKNQRRKGYGRYLVACIKDLAMAAMPPKQRYIPIFVCSTEHARKSFWSTPSVGFEDVVDRSAIHNGFSDTCLLQFVVSRHDSPTHHRDMCCAEFSNLKLTIMEGN